VHRRTINCYGGGGGGLRWVLPERPQFNTTELGNVSTLKAYEKNKISVYFGTRVQFLNDIF
jgi:hypothetical protein